MDPLVLTLRLLHVGFGVFWAGAVMFSTFFLMPAVADAGPDGGKVMAALQRRRILEVLPLVALITIGSGFWLYFRMANGDPAWARSRVGMALGVGGLAAVLALIAGLTVMRPANLKAMALAASVMKMSEGPDRAAQMVVLQGLRRRGVLAARVIALLLMVTTALMAVARYL
ncbi:MAG TPA: hypothetical protein VGA78_00135 [Gemmatimonadales bacterium]